MASLAISFTFDIETAIIDPELSFIDHRSDVVLKEQFNESEPTRFVSTLKTSYTICWAYVLYLMQCIPQSGSNSQCILPTETTFLNLTVYHPPDTAYSKRKVTLRMYFKFTYSTQQEHVMQEYDHHCSIDGRAHVCITVFDLSPEGGWSQRNRTFARA